MKQITGLAKVRSSLVIIKIPLVFLFFLTLYFTGYGEKNTLAKKGVLDLTTHNWVNNGIVNLNGEWAFYWQKLYTPGSLDSLQSRPSTYSYVPGFWNRDIPGKGIFQPAFGYATYHLKILCPDSPEKLSLKFLTVASAYKLFVNGKQLLEVGKVGTTRATTSPAYDPVIVPVTPLNNQLDIVIQVANFNYSTGGLWDFIKLGPNEKIHSFWLRNVGLDFFIAGGFFLIGLFYLVIFFYNRKQLAPLYFSIFCLMLSKRPLLTDELAIHYLFNWDWQVIKRLEFLSMYLTVPMLSLFSAQLFPKEFSKKLLKAILFISVPFVLLALFASPFIFRYSLRPFQVFMFLTACYGMAVYVKAVRKKRPGGIYFLTGFIILFFTIINDLLYTSLYIQSVHLVYVGLLIFIISQAIALSRQFFWTFTRLEVVNSQLEKFNTDLSQKNIVINEANEELTKLNSELDILVSRTSHDLRSPITSIVALVHIIKNEKDEGRRNEYLDLQRKTLHRLNGLITDILDFSKNKRTELQFEKVDFNELVDGALQDHFLSDDSGNIERIVNVDQRVTFFCDKSRLNMILYNLISNALKYHNKEQHKPYLKIDVTVLEHEAKIEVADNGLGIGEKHLEHIFTMFYRANKSFAGSGLGLYIVNEAVEKLGGEIKIESELNVGTHFMITIPNHNK
ncbi:MAG: sensor histidine kinase [Ginsengibacter sp.]